MATAFEKLKDDKAFWQASPSEQTLRLEAMKPGFVKLSKNEQFGALTSLQRQYAAYREQTDFNLGNVVKGLSQVPGQMAEGYAKTVQSGYQSGPIGLAKDLAGLTRDLASPLVPILSNSMSGGYRPHGDISKALVGGGLQGGKAFIEGVGNLPRDVFGFDTPKVQLPAVPDDLQRATEKYPAFGAVGQNAPFVFAPAGAVGKGAQAALSATAFNAALGFASTPGTINERTMSAALSGGLTAAPFIGSKVLKGRGEPIVKPSPNPEPVVDPAVEVELRQRAIENRQAKVDADAKAHAEFLKKVHDSGVAKETLEQNLADTRKIARGQHPMFKDKSIPPDVLIARRMAATKALDEFHSYRDAQKEYTKLFKEAEKQQVKPDKSVTPPVAEQLPNEAITPTPYRVHGEMAPGANKPVLQTIKVKAEPEITYKQTQKNPVTPDELEYLFNNEGVHENSERLTALKKDFILSNKELTRWLKSERGVDVKKASGKELGGIPKDSLREFVRITQDANAPNLIKEPAAGATRSVSDRVARDNTVYKRGDTAAMTPDAEGYTPRFRQKINDFYDTFDLVKDSPQELYALYKKGKLTKNKMTEAELSAYEQHREVIAKRLHELNGPPKSKGVNPDEFMERFGQGLPKKQRQSLEAYVQAAKEGKAVEGNYYAEQVGSGETSSVLKVHDRPISFYERDGKGVIKVLNENGQARERYVYKDRNGSRVEGAVITDKQHPAASYDYKGKYEATRVHGDGTVNLKGEEGDLQVFDKDGKLIEQYAESATKTSDSLKALQDAGLGDMIDRIKSGEKLTVAESKKLVEEATKAVQDIIDNFEEGRKGELTDLAKTLDKDVFKEVLDNLDQEGRQKMHKDLFDKDC